MPACPRCAFEAPAGAAECPLCRAPLAGVAASPSGPPVAWEDARRGFPGNLSGTLRESMIDPAGFFPRVEWDAPLARAVLYLLLVSVLSAFFTLLWTAAGVQPTGFEDLESMTGLSEGAFVLLNFTVTPFAALVGLLLSTLVFHLFVLMLMPARRRMRATARAVCYASGPGLLTIVPWAGTLVGTVWAVVLLIFGLRSAHRSTGGRAAVAVLLPAALVFGFLVLVVALAVALGKRLQGLPGGALPLP